MVFRKAMINAPVLAFPHYKLPFVTYSVASTLELGVVQMHQDARGKHSAVASSSRTQNQTESNFSLIHQKTLAVV